MASKLQVSWNDPDARRKLIERLSLGGLLLLFLIEAFVLLPHGVFGAADSIRYIGGGEHVAQGLPPLAFKGASYIGYIALVAASIIAGTGLYGVVVVQLLLAVLAIFALYDLGCGLGGHWTGLVAAGLLVADSWLTLQNFLIMTEASYTSMVVITAWAAYRAAEDGGVYYLLGALVLALTITLRPNGYVLLPIVAIYWVWRKGLDLRWRWLATSLIVVAFLAVAVLPSKLHSVVVAENPVRTLRNGVTVWGLPYLRVQMPQDPVLGDDQWGSAVSYGIRYPIQTSALMLLRLSIHFSNYRPDYPVGVNLTSTAWLLYIYPLAVLGFLHARKHPVAGISLPIIAVHAVIVAFTWAEWRGRFLFYTMPLFYLFCAEAVTRPGIPPRSLVWKLIQALGVGVVIVRIVSGNFASSMWMTGDSFIFFGTPSPANTTLHTVAYNDHLNLLGFEPIKSPVHAGTLAPITLYWLADQHLTVRYKASIQLVDDSGSRIGGVDSLLGGNFFYEDSPYITSRWAPGVRMADRLQVDIPANSPRKLSLYVTILRGGNKPIEVIQDNGQAVNETRVLLQTLDVEP